MNKFGGFIVAFLLLQIPIFSQELGSIDIESCYEWARAQYPISKQMDILDQTAMYNIKNAAKGFLPQISIHGQASYQSEVTEIPVEVPNLSIPALSQDQYQVYAEIYQSLTNRSSIKLNQQQQLASAAIEKQQLDIELYQLKDRINQIYFGLLLIDNQIQQLDILQEDLDSTIEKTAAAITNGTAIENNQLLLEAEKVNTIQKIRENLANRAAFINMLALLTGQNIGANTQLEQPVEKQYTIINRPELKLYELRQQLLILQDKTINQRLIPNIGLFLQAGYGRPALNFLNNDFNGYYVGGLRMNWNLSNLYTSRNDRQVLELSRQKIHTQKETFLLNTNLTLNQQSAEIQKYEELIQADQALIEIRTSIKNTAEDQLLNGLISALDYVSYINAESTARQNLALHQTQLLLAQYNLMNTAGN